MIDLLCSHFGPNASWAQEARQSIWRPSSNFTQHRRPLRDLAFGARELFIDSEPGVGIGRILALQWEAGKLKARSRNCAAHQAHYPTVPPLAHCCAALFPVEPDAPANYQHSHTSIWGGCGFGAVEKYVVGRPIEKSLFDEPGVIPDAVRERQKNWVVAVYELLEWCDFVDSRP
ncbi:hypothetical protein BDK51DRAFT_32339 [Blyttiomyces helicus]|uniref:Uncharacterized protein n=1 Tax=Blyttiomyces helicus TaxID=388810 RepID=A0A4P9W2A1_9FUNG|nr:hypothetical protein BDK51DRAFT_32339 [Blyttiomyces helicus]|eukprot:RKO85485.1 hypothetical protein BDK51DRAFT_32339 [Blyttiomyces helicus]